MDDQADATEATDDEPPTRQELVDEVSSRIRDQVGEQAEWKAYGGDVSSIRELNDNLIIITSRVNHDAIAKLIASLRREAATEKSEYKSNEAKQSGTKANDPLKPLKGTIWDKKSEAAR